MIRSGPLQRKTPLRSKPKCSLCHETGHYAKRCPSAGPQEPARPASEPAPPAEPKCDVLPRTLTSEESDAIKAGTGGKIVLTCTGGLPFGACLCIYGACDHCGKAHPHVAGQPCPVDPVAAVLAFYHERRSSKPPTPVLARVGPSPLRARPKPLARVRDRDYLDYLKTLPCCVCGATEGVVGHHFGEHGVSTKTHDLNSAPLCHECHINQWHLSGSFKGMSRLESERAIYKGNRDALRMWIFSERGNAPGVEQ